MLMKIMSQPEALGAILPAPGKPGDGPAKGLAGMVQSVDAIVNKFLEVLESIKKPLKAVVDKLPPDEGAELRR